MIDLAREFGKLSHLQVAAKLNRQLLFSLSGGATAVP